MTYGDHVSLPAMTSIHMDCTPPLVDACRAECGAKARKYVLSQVLHQVIGGRTLRDPLNGMAARV